MPAPSSTTTALTVPRARALGAAFADVAAQADGAAVVGHDAHPTTAELAAAFAAGLSGRGVDALVVGPCTPGVLAYGCGSLELPGVMFSAGSRAGDAPADVPRAALYGSDARQFGSARGTSPDPELAAVLERAEGYLAGRVADDARPSGRISTRDLLPGYAGHLRSLVDLRSVGDARAGGHLTVVVSGDPESLRTVAAVLGTGAGLPALPLALLHPASEHDLRGAVVGHHADLGIVLDAATGSLAVLDERGDPVSPSVVAAVIGLRAVERDQQDGNPPTVVLDRLASRAVPDLLAGSGATVVTAARGSLVRAELAARAGVVGLESDGRYAFRDTHYAAAPILAAMHLLAALAGGGAMSELAEAYQPYAGSGELGVRLGGADDVAAARDRVVEAYVTRQGAGPVSVEGPADGPVGSEPLTISHWDDSPRWWFSLHAAGARDPIDALVLTVEAADEDIMEKVREDVLALLRAAPPRKPALTHELHETYETHETHETKE